jgi:hypothetical protein
MYTVGVALSDFGIGWHEAAVVASIRTTDPHTNSNLFISVTFSAGGTFTDSEPTPADLDTSRPPSGVSDSRVVDIPMIDK